MGALLSGRTGSWLQINWLSLRNNRLELKIAGKLSAILEELIEYTPINEGQPDDANM